MSTAEYRLVIFLDAQKIPYESDLFDRFGAAQAQVAPAVLELSRAGRVHRAAVQCRSPRTTLNPTAKAADGRDMFSSSDGAARWVTLKEWDSAVIDRIVQQEQLQALAEAQRTRAAQPRPLKRPRAVARYFRRTRYAAAGTSAMLAFVLCSIFIWQAGGKPTEVFTMIKRETKFEDATRHALERFKPAGATSPKPGELSSTGAPALHWASRDAAQR